MLLEVSISVILLSSDEVAVVVVGGSLRGFGVIIGFGVVVVASGKDIEIEESGLGEVRVVVVA